MKSGSGSVAVRPTHPTRSHSHVLRAAYLRRTLVIYHLKLFKLSLREIARRLGRHHSTISREIKRNGPFLSTWVYWHEDAHQQALARRKQARHHRRHSYAPLLQYVEQGLRADYSPDVITARLKMEHPGDTSYCANAHGVPSVLVKPHALYQALGADSTARQIAYRELFRFELEPGLVDEIRRATNGNFALGDTRFGEEVARLVGRRVQAGKAGRPRKLSPQTGPDWLK